MELQDDFNKKEEGLVSLLNSDSDSDQHNSAKFMQTSTAEDSNKKNG